MKITNVGDNEIIKDENLNLKFLSIYHDDIKSECKVLIDSFYLDSFNYFPITEDMNSFKEIYTWGDSYKYKNFYSNNFLEIFNNEKHKYKEISNAFVLGSSPVDNYYRNMITFLPRIFFSKEKNINLVIHRNLSNKFRKFIETLCVQLKIKINKLIFLDDNFYKFTKSQMPQFLDKKKSIHILNKLPNNKQKNKGLKIYLSRQNSSYRNIINEGDVTEEIKKIGFKILDLNNLEITKQIEYFSNAEIIISATSSALTNIVFCKKGTKIIEISPNYKFDYERSFKERYSFISKELKLDYTSIIADPIKLKKNNTRSNKYISKEVLANSNYYKDLLVKIDDIKKVIKKFSI